MPTQQVQVHRGNSDKNCDCCHIRHTEPIRNPQPTDVLVDEIGVLEVNHQGNDLFQKLIISHRDAFEKADENEKRNIAIRIYSRLSRFLRKLEIDNGNWYSVGETVAIHTTYNALQSLSVRPSVETLRLWEEVRESMDNKSVDVAKFSESLKQCYRHLNTSKEARKFFCGSAKRNIEPEAAGPCIPDMVLGSRFFLTWNENVRQLAEDCLEKSVLISAEYLSRFDAIVVQYAIIEVLGTIFDKSCLYYRGDAHHPGYPEVRMKMVKKFCEAKGIARLTTLFVSVYYCCDDCYDYLTYCCKQYTHMTIEAILEAGYADELIPMKTILFERINSRGQLALHWCCHHPIMRIKGLDPKDETVEGIVWFDVKFALEMFEKGARHQDNDGNYPLHIGLKNLPVWKESLRRCDNSDCFVKKAQKVYHSTLLAIMYAAPFVLEIKDKQSHLFPFQLAACNGANLDILYQALLLHPICVASGIR